MAFSGLQSLEVFEILQTWFLIFKMSSLEKMFAIGNYCYLHKLHGDNTCIH